MNAMKNIIRVSKEFWLLESRIKRGGSGMVLDCSSLENALGQLEESLIYLASDGARQDPAVHRLFRTAVIKSFEYTYELAIKMIRRKLAQIVAHPAGLREIDFMEVIRLAYEADLIQEVPRYKRFREVRNITSHTYNQSKADEALNIMKDFIAEMQYLLHALQQSRS